MKGRFLKVEVADDGTVLIEGAPESLTVLAEVCSMKAKHPNGYFATIVGHGPPKVRVEVPGAHAPVWMTAFDNGADTRKEAISLVKQLLTLVESPGGARKDADTARLVNETKRFLKLGAFD